jgi:hypothetical protein
MKESTKEADVFFCSRKMPDGSYCTQKSKPAAVASPQAPGVASDDLLSAAALIFAGLLYQGGGVPQTDVALMTAKKALETMRQA